MSAPAQQLPAAAVNSAARLADIATPEQLRSLSPEQLPEIATQLRSFVLQSVAASGGHLAAGLGVVDLTVALHYVFDTPRDTLVWDIGHQCYPHKVLTGRRERLKSVRQRHGLSGFLQREESPYDSFGAGHSSTSISAALGMALADACQGLARQTVAIIGDGALTAGLAYEALNHAGGTHANLLLILNDNDMSISESVGALGQSLRRQRDARGGNSTAAWFGQLGWQYSGPVDGHDLPGLLVALRRAKEGSGPRLLHVQTRKGHGYAPAEANPIAYHGVGPFDTARGLTSPAPASSKISCSQVFGDWMCEEAARNPRLLAITPAMREGSGLVRFQREHPQRYFDVGIAEQHSVTLAAGLACHGMRPVVAIYSTFLQRAYDQLIHDVCIQKLPVVFALDRAGIVGPDGATHNGAFDLSFLRCVPNMIVMTPADGVELRNMLQTAVSVQAPVAIRYPRANVETLGLQQPAAKIPVGTAQLRRSGRRVAFLAFGAMLTPALQAAEVLDASVVNMRFLKPLDAAMVLRMSRRHELLVTLEDNVVAGGAGSAVSECLREHGATARLLQLGLPDRFMAHATREQVLQEAGLDQEGILGSVRRQLAVLGSARPAPVPTRRERLRSKRPSTRLPGGVALR
jgi:1-deoxy-D-xylulose-5-phosphate synthase